MGDELYTRDGGERVTGSVLALMRSPVLDMSGERGEEVSEGEEDAAAVVMGVRTLSEGWNAVRGERVGE